MTQNIYFLYPLSLTISLSKVIILLVFRSQLCMEGEEGGGGGGEDLRKTLVYMHSSMSMRVWI